MRMTTKLAKIGSWEYDPVAQTQKWSDETFDIHELEPGHQPTPQQGIRYYVPMHRPIIQKLFHSAINEGKPYDAVLQIETEKGNLKWVRTIGEPIKEGGKIVKISGAFQDITRLKTVENELEWSEKKADEIIYHMPSALFVYALSDEDELILESGNPEALRQVGMQLNGKIGKTFDDLWPGARKIGLTEAFLNVAKTGKYYSNERLEYQDERISGVFRVHAFRLPRNRLAVGFDNITFKEEMKDRLQASEEKCRQLFETMLQGVVYQSKEGEIIEANPAAERILGLTFDQMRGRSSMDPRWKAIDEDGKELPGEHHPSMVALKTGKQVTGFLMGVFNPKLGENRWIIVNAVPQINHDLIPIGVYTTFEDVTDRIRYEHTLQEALKRASFAFEITGSALWEWDIKADRMIFNRETATQIGFNADEIEMSMNEWLDRIHPDSGDSFRNAVESITCDGADTFNVVYQLRNQNGGYITFEHRGKVVNRGPDGTPRTVMGVLKTL